MMMKFHVAVLCLSLCLLCRVDYSEIVMFSWFVLRVTKVTHLYIATGMLSFRVSASDVRLMSGQ